MPSPTVQASSPPATPAVKTQVKFTTPLASDPNLDADDDEEEEHRHRTLDNILGTDVAHGLAHCDAVEAELHAMSHAVSVEEPKSLKEANVDPN